MKLMSNLKKVDIAIIFIVLCFVIGPTLLLSGLSEYNRMTYESFNLPRAMMILADDNTTIYDMRLVLSCDEFRTRKDEGWMGTLIWLNLSCGPGDLVFHLPHRIDITFPGGYEIKNASYDESDDITTLVLSYESVWNGVSEVIFDWKILEKISYDQERVAICFKRPVYYAKSWFEYSPVLRRYLGPEIDRLTIQIEGNHPLDFSFTNPQPSYYYLSEGITSAYWTFDPEREITSVQAVFKDPILSKKKSNIIFFSGLYTAVSISIIFLGLKELLDFLRKLKVKKR